MNVNVYLPDDLARRAKTAELPFSRLLREAVTAELERRKTMTQTLQTSYDSFVEMADAEGRRYQGRITGQMIASEGNIRIYLTNDERVLLYDGDVLDVRTIEDPQAELRSLNQYAYVAAMRMLGISPIVDL